MRRRSISRRKSFKQFKKYARTHKRNMPKVVSRGGYCL